jgi:hypothetical protein
MSGRAALIVAIPCEWMVLPQLQIGAWQVLDMPFEVTCIVLLDYERAERGVNLSVALGIKHGDLQSRMVTISYFLSRFCDSRHRTAE